MMAEERSAAVILGRHVGTHTGWDQFGDFAICFYDFVPSEGVDLPEGDLSVLYETGRVEYWAEDGTITYAADVVSMLSTVPVSA